MSDSPFDSKLPCLSNVCIAFYSAFDFSCSGSITQGPFSFDLNTCYPGSGGGAEQVLYGIVFPVCVGSIVSGILGIAIGVPVAILVCCIVLGIFLCQRSRANAHMATQAPAASYSNTAVVMQPTVVTTTAMQPVAMQPVAMQPYGQPQPQYGQPQPQYGQPQPQYGQPQPQYGQQTGQYGQQPQYGQQYPQQAGGQPQYV